MRPQIFNILPQEWKDRKEKGICPVCAKEKKDFGSRRRSYCSETCKEKWDGCWFTWDGMRERIFQRDGLKCKNCNSTHIKTGLNIDHIVPLMAGGKMWDESNLQVLCKDCHKNKTKTDLKKSIPLTSFIPLTNRTTE